jgi:hypothetical protein
MMHRVKVKIPLKSKHDYHLKCWIPVKTTGCYIKGSTTYEKHLLRRAPD